LPGAVPTNDESTGKRWRRSDSTRPSAAPPESHGGKPRSPVAVAMGYYAP
jgi:hypothetical protein